MLSIMKKVKRPDILFKSPKWQNSLKKMGGPILILVLEYLHVVSENSYSFMLYLDYLFLYDVFKC